MLQYMQTCNPLLPNKLFKKKVSRKVRETVSWFESNNGFSVFIFLGNGRDDCMRDDQLILLKIRLRVVLIISGL